MQNPPKQARKGMLDFTQIQHYNQSVKERCIRIRYHDLRHSCASLLLANGVPMKQIQEWLGHSDFSTTANVYAHLECNSKRLSAEAMTNGLQRALNVIS